MKNAIMQVIYFLKSPVFICYFIVILFILSESRLLMRNLVIILPLTLKSKLSGKFQRFSANDGSSEMLKNSWISKKFQLKSKIKNEVHEAQTASKSKEIITPSTTPTPLDKILLPLWNNNFDNYICKNIQKYTEICFKNAVFGCQEMAHCKCFFFWHQRETCLLKNL